MTKEEKIAILKDIIDGEIINPQVRSNVGIWAIKALEQSSYNSVKTDLKSCTDAISRQAALDCFTATKLKKFDFILHAREEIKKLPPVNPQNCDKCEVGNPCLYCKHEFEERSDKE